MGRKTSKLPTRVYKYRLYAPQGATAERTTEGFCNARVHYNKLITIERRRRALYRAERTRLFPELAALEARQAEFEARIKALRDEVQGDKVKSKSRAVDPAKKAAIAELCATKKVLLPELRAMRATCAASPGLQTTTKRIDAQAQQEIKALRKGTYWGTYLLVEAAARAACGAMKDPDYETTPPHRLQSRIGVHFCGGVAPSEIVGGQSNLMRIAPVHFRLDRHDKEIATGKAARTTLQIRIGSQGRCTPVWATLPMIMHRPLPDDARIKDAYITRARFTVRIPWQYHLCVVLEAASFEHMLPGPQQEGTTAINFGWRSTKRGLRVAMLNHEGGTPEEVLLPPSYIGLEHRRRTLASTLASQFNMAKKCLVGWLQDHTCPDGFRETFAALTKWDSRHRFAAWMDYWQEHRFEGDDEIFTALAAREDPAARRGAAPWTREAIAQASWMVHYRHLQTWLDSVQRKLGNWRDYYYRCLAKRLATTSACLCVEAFDMRKVAKGPIPEEPEDQGDEHARSNRQLASVSDLRLKILQAAAKYHCRVVAVPAENNTRRCNVCGEVHPWSPKKEIVHVCANPRFGAVWDQDVNNTDRQHVRIASGEVVSLVTPAEKREIADGSSTVEGSQACSLGTARKELAKRMKIK